MADRTAGLKNPLIRTGGCVPSVHISGVGSHERPAATHDDFGARSGQLAPQFFSPSQPERSFRKLPVEAGPLQIAMERRPSVRRGARPVCREGNRCRAKREAQKQPGDNRAAAPVVGLAPRS